MNTLTAQQLQDLIARRGQEDAHRQAEQILNDVGAGRVDIGRDPADMAAFADFLETFGGHVDDRGEFVLNQAGAAATARFQGMLDQLEGVVNCTAENRIYSRSSDYNTIMENAITFQVFQQMRLIDSNLDARNMTPAQIASHVDAVAPKLTEDQRMRYADLFVARVIDDPEMFQQVPPLILANAYRATKQMAARGTASQRNAAGTRLEKIAARMDELIGNVADRVQYCHADTSNIADVYVGYMAMFAARAEDLQPDNQAHDKLRQQIAHGRDLIVGMMRDYDNVWNLNGLTPQDSAKMQDRWNQLTAALKNITVSDSVLKTASAHKFLDEQGNPIPQFLDEHGNPVADFAPGRKLDNNGRLARLIELAKNDVAMQHAGDLATDVSTIDLQAALDERIPWKFMEVSVPDQVAQGITQDPQKFQNDKYAADYFNGVVPTTDISNDGWDSACDAQVNSAAGWSGRVASLVGRDAPIATASLDAVADLDKLGVDGRTESGEVRGKRISIWKRALKNFGVAAGVSAGLTFIGKATGVAWAGAAVGVTLGIGAMVWNGMKWRREQKKAGKPHGIKAFFRDKRNWGPAVASGLGIAAVISMATGNPELAAGFGVGALVAGTGSSAVMTYKDMVRTGHSKGQALGGALAIGASGVLGAIVGRASMNAFVDYVNNNTDSTMFKTGHEQIVEHKSTVRSYDQNIIEHHKEMMLNNGWETQAQMDAHLAALQNAGLSHDQAVRYLLFWHDTTSHSMGQWHAANHFGVTPEQFAAMQHSISGNTVHLTPDALAAFSKFDGNNEYGHIIDGLNRWGSTNNAPVIDDWSAKIAAYDENGMLVPGHDTWSTWVTNNDGSVMVDTPVITQDVTTVFTPNELGGLAGLGTFGIYEPRPVPAQYFRRLKERAGALMDRIENMQSQEKDVPSPAPTPTPQPAPEPQPAPTPAPEQGMLPPHMDAPQKLLGMGDKDNKALVPTHRADKRHQLPPHHQGDQVIVPPAPGQYGPQPGPRKKDRYRDIEDVEFEDILPTDAQAVDSPDGAPRDEQPATRPQSQWDLPSEWNGQNYSYVQTPAQPAASQSQWYTIPSLDTGGHAPHREPGHEPAQPAQPAQSAVKIPGFFRTAKEVIYKTMQATKHGLEKTIEGVQQMGHDYKQRSIQNKTETANASLELIEAENAKKMKKMEGEIKRQMAELEAQLATDSVKRNHARTEEIKAQQHELKQLREKIKRAKQANQNSEDLLGAKKLKRELARIEKAMELDTAQSDRAIKKEQGKTWGDKFRNAGNALSSFFRGVGQTDEDDIASARAAGRKRKTKAATAAHIGTMDAAKQKVIEKIKEGKPLTQKEQALFDKLLGEIGRGE